MLDLVGLTGDATVIEAEGIAKFVGLYLQMSEAGFFGKNFSHTTRYHQRVFFVLATSLSGVAPRDCLTALVPF